MSVVYIYILRDPKNNDIRYVGKTVQNPSDRLTSHIRQAKREKKSYKDRWILKVLKKRNKPIMEVVEKATEDNWIEREQYWIAKCRKDGCKLTNVTDGGEGLHGHEFSKEHRGKIGKAQIGNKRGLGNKHTEEYKENASKRMKGKANPNYGKIFSKEYRDKLSKAQKGRTHPEETKQKMSSSAKGNQRAKGHKQTEEHKRKILEAINRVCIHCGRKIKRMKRGSDTYVHRHNKQRECDNMTTFAE